MLPAVLGGSELAEEFQCDTVFSLWSSRERNSVSSRDSGPGFVLGDGGFVWLGHK